MTVRSVTSSFDDVTDSCRASYSVLSTSVVAVSLYVTDDPSTVGTDGDGPYFASVSAEVDVRKKPRTGTR